MRGWRRVCRRARAGHQRELAGDAGPHRSVAAARQRVRNVEQQLINVQSAASQSANDYATASSQVAVLNDSIRVNQAQLALTKAELASAQPPWPSGSWVCTPIRRRR